MIHWIKEKAARAAMDIYWKSQNSKKRKKQLKAAGMLNSDPQFHTVSYLEEKIERDRGIEFVDAKNVSVTVDVISNNVLRVCCRPNGKSRLQKTWTVSGNKQSISAEGRCRDDYSIFDKTEFSVVSGNTNVRVRTEKVDAVISLNPFRLDWYDSAGKKFASDDAKTACQYSSGDSRVRHTVKLNPQASLYGFGEKAGALNKIGRKMLMMNVDVMGYNAKKQDPMYKHIPFYINLNDDGCAWGIFYDNLSMSEFDVGKKNRNQIIFSADDGDIDYYMIYGPSIAEVVRGYAALTGHMIMQPKWSLGYLGSTMTYTESENAQEELRQFADLCAEHEIPCDLFHLSSGYTSGAENKRYVFNWNSSKISSPKDMVNYFHNNGIKISANIKPCLLTTHPRFKEVNSFKGFIREAKSESPHITPFWGGEGAYLDFTNENTRSWWKSNIKEHLLSYGIDSTWNDNNEYEIWDNGCRCSGFGEELSVNQIRPIQTLLMTKTSLEIQQELNPDKRQYAICRSGCPGIQRYAQTWTGDNFTSWESLKYNIPMALGLSLSGVSNIGHDVGGFYGFKPSPELFLRWVQSGIMNPRFTIHSWHIDKTVNEPWMFPEILSMIRDTIKFRYRLIPYFYSIMHGCCITGDPILRPLIYEFQNDVNTRNLSFEYLYGSHLLAAPVYKKSQRKRKIYLPAGVEWIDYYTGQHYNGGTHIQVDAPLNRIPLMVREGGIITLGKSMKFVGAEADDYRQILLYPKTGESESEFIMYDDDGESMRYLRGAITRSCIKMSSTENTVHADIHSEGDYTLPYKNLELLLTVGDDRSLSSNLRVIDKGKDALGRIFITVVLRED